MAKTFTTFKAEDVQLTGQLRDMTGSDGGSTGGKMVFLSGATEIKTPELYMPFGLTAKYNCDPEDPKSWVKPGFTVALSKDSDEVKTFTEQLDKLKEKVVAYAMENQDWAKTLKLKKKTTPDAVAAKFYDFYKVPEEEDHHPQMNLRMNWDWKASEPSYKLAQCFTVSEDGPEQQQPTLETVRGLLTKGARVRLMLKLRSIWFLNGKGGLTVTVTSLIVRKKQAVKAATFSVDDFMTEEVEEVTGAVEKMSVVADEEFDEED